MDDLIEALTILKKYLQEPGTRWPTTCEHDVLYVIAVDPELMRPEEVARLEELGFEWDDCGSWRSHRFGSC